MAREIWGDFDSFSFARVTDRIVPDTRPWGLVEGTLSLNLDLWSLFSPVTYCTLSERAETYKIIKTRQKPPANIQSNPNPQTLQPEQGEIPAQHQQQPERHLHGTQKTAEKRKHAT